VNESGASSMTMSQSSSANEPMMPAIDAWYLQERLGTHLHLRQRSRIEAQPKPSHAVGDARPRLGSAEISYLPRN
jgi:hypothetical protein